jgi:hypothetical protein
MRVTQARDCLAVWRYTAESACWSRTPRKQIKEPSGNDRLSWPGSTTHAVTGELVGDGFILNRRVPTYLAHLGRPLLGSFQDLRALAWLLADWRCSAVDHTERWPNAIDRALTVRLI